MIAGWQAETAIDLLLAVETDLQLTHVHVAARDKQTTLPIERRIRIVVPDAWANQAVEFHVRGLRESVALAEATFQVTPVANEVVPVHVRLRPLPCAGCEAPIAPTVACDAVTPCPAPPAPTCVDTVTLRTTLPASCPDGVCRFGSADTVCPTGRCAQGACVMPTPCEQACDDGNACNGLETCAPNGQCVPGSPLDCNDRDDCTNDICRRDRGCLHTPIDQDNDGVGPGACGGDCDDLDATIHPGQLTWFKTVSRLGGWDYNCDGTVEMRVPGLGEVDPAACTVTKPGWIVSVPACGATGRMRTLAPSDSRPGVCSYGSYEATQYCR